MHKACGWMLREVGKREVKPLMAFLDQHASQMPRTMLRYAIEKLPENTRQAYLAMKR
jgi:3-methyladenine DNA glycosylase AlkD